MRGDDAAFRAVTTLVAWNENRDCVNARDLFAGFAHRLKPSTPGDALQAARDWLMDPAFSANEWELVEDGLRWLRSEPMRPIDWSAEVAAALANPQMGIDSFGLSMPLAKAISRVLDYPLSGSFACLYSASASIAWELSAERQVTLFADRDVGIAMALLARVACRPLRVSRCNPLDGTFTPGPLGFETDRREPPFEAFDHILSMPPFGVRVSEGPSKGMPFEAYHIARLMDRARHSFTALVTDGMLFRETKAELDFRQKLLAERSVTIMSLPPGMFWPATSVSASLLQLECDPDELALMIDGRSMEKVSTGRVQEKLIVQHLESFRGLRSKDEERAEQVYVDELATNGFSLLPDRYLKRGDLAAIKKALENRRVVTLGDVASVERNKAPLPIPEGVEDPPIMALEIAPMDIIDGQVRTPTRQQVFELDQESRVKGTTVGVGDILVSIKGNIGNVGMVALDAEYAALMKEPWVISQSLAIVRWKPDSAIPSAEILNAILTAPWVREKLESMSGGATVRSLPISALRSLTIPVPTAEECAVAQEEMKQIAELREVIANHQSNLAERHQALWSQLWQVPVLSGDS